MLRSKERPSRISWLASSTGLSRQTIRPRASHRRPPRTDQTPPPLSDCRGSLASPAVVAVAPALTPAAPCPRVPRAGSRALGASGPALLRVGVRRCRVVLERWFRLAGLSACRRLCGAWSAASGCSAGAASASSRRTTRRAGAAARTALHLEADREVRLQLLELEPRLQRVDVENNPGRPRRR